MRPGVVELGAPAWLAPPPMPLVVAGAGAATGGAVAGEAPGLMIEPAPDCAEAIADEDKTAIAASAARRTRDFMKGSIVDFDGATIRKRVRSAAHDMVMRQAMRSACSASAIQRRIAA